MAEPASPKVLLVEDHKGLRQLISIHLRKSGFEVQEVNSMKAAVDALETQDYDLVIADVHLPDGDTTSGLHWQHVTRPGLPFIFITGDDDRDLATRVLAEDPAGFLIKPFEFSELIAVAREAVETPRAVSQVRHGSDKNHPIPVMWRPSLPDPSIRIPSAVLVKFAIVAVLLMMIALAIGVRLAHEILTDEAKAHVAAPRAP